MQHLSKQMRTFANLPDYVTGNAEFLDWLNSNNPELDIPECWETDKKLCECGVWVCDSVESVCVWVLKVCVDSVECGKLRNKFVI